MRKLKMLLVIWTAHVALAAATPDWITSLGGKVTQDAKGEIVAINLRSSWVSDIELLDISHFRKLERLDLSHTRITDEGMHNLSSLTGIRELKLTYAEQITDQGMRAIRNWTMLRRLDLRGTRISNGTLDIAGHLPHLEALDIANTQVTDNGMDLLIELTNLKELALGRSRVGEGDLGFLRMLPSLTVLDLSGARPVPPDMGNARRKAKPPTPIIPAKTVEALAELKNLRTLKMGFSGVSPADLKALRVLDKVEKLGLEECPRVDDAAVQELVQWKSLKYVDLQATKVTAQGVETLRKAKPAIVVLYNSEADSPKMAESASK